MNREMLNYLRKNDKYNLICLDDVLEIEEVKIGEAALVLSREVDDFSVSNYLDWKNSCRDKKP
jgi:hypothetical protein